ncbi:tRNA-dihydrouridine synthase, partial [human gut metagenome]
NVIPQILTNNSKYFIYTMNEMKNMGYDEVNLNLGCPSGTVVAKGRGSGFLAHKDELDRFLDAIFSKTEIKLS